MRENGFYAVELQKDRKCKIGGYPGSTVDLA